MILGKNIYYIILFACICGITVQACQDTYTPKPHGFARMYFPEKKYMRYDGKDCPFIFRIPVYAQVVKDNDRGAMPCWLNIDFPQFNGTIHLSYHSINSSQKLNDLKEDSRKLVFKHTVKATEIDESDIKIKDRNIYGKYYEIGGNAASSFQFYITDNEHNFLRGALYLNTEPNIDSIAPVISFIKKDVDVMITSFKWKK